MKSNKGLIVTVIILIIIVLGMGGYLTYDKLIKKNDVVETNTVEKVEEPTENSEVEVNTNTSIGGFDSSKVINNDKNIYSLQHDTNGLYVGYKKDASESMKLYVTYTKDYASGYSVDTAGINETNEVEITPDKKINDVYVGGFGQDISRTTILLLMEDGTVEYIPVAYALKNKDIKIYGTLDGVSDIVRMSGSVATTRENGVSGWVTTLAIKADGTFYDLNDVLPEQYYKLY